MEVRLEKAIEHDAQSIFSMQVRTFRPLLKKYKDFHTNPANETIKKMIKKINNPTGGFYKIMVNDKLAGAICIFKKEAEQFWISPMFIHPSFQGQGIAQTSITLLEKTFPQATTWELATIQEEKRNCHLYEKMGYKPTGVSRKLNESTTLIFYKKVL